jgi:hypothetical protein
MKRGVLRIDNVRIVDEVLQLVMTLKDRGSAKQGSIRRRGRFRREEEEEEVTSFQPHQAD